MSMEDEKLDLRDLVKQVLRRRWLIAALVAAFAALAMVVAVLQPRNYEAVILLAPASDDAGGSGTEAALRGVGGLAALAGLAPAGGGKAAESMAVLESESLTRKFIEDNGLLPVLYEDRWEPTTKDWKAADKKDAPTLWMAARLFREDVRSVNLDAGTGLITLTVRWEDPQMAAQWANGLVALANQYLRDKAISQSERNIAYLNEQAGRTSVVEVRQAMFNLMQGELKRVMLARGSDEYAFKVIDPATVPEKPTIVSPLLLVVAGIMVGLLIGLFVALVELAWNGSR